MVSTPDRRTNTNGGHTIGSIGSSPRSRSPRRGMMHQLLPSGVGSGRSLKFLIAALVAYAMSLQFNSAFRNLEPAKARYGELEFEPPGARRWAAGNARAKEGRTPVNHRLRVRGERDSQQQHDDSKDEPKQKQGERDSQHDDSNSKDTLEQEQSSPSRRRPRMVAIELTRASLSVVPIAIKSHSSNDFSEDSMPENPPQIKPSWYEPNAEEFIDGYDWEVCEPMYEWQLESYPNCNNFHELDLQHLRMINTGGSRIAFEMQQYLDDGKAAKFVYKTVKYSKEITMKLVEEQRKDSVVMERTSSSQFIPDIHGYCSLGVMMDFMPEGNMHDYIKGARLAGGSTLSPVDRLRLSIHIATSVADLHTIDGTPMPSVFHNDICCHQYLFQNGVFKLNDFNYARPIYINKKTNEQCTRTGFGMAMWKARSLEEHQKDQHHPDSGPVKPDKIDVWMMGNLIYYMLTDLYTFEKPENLSFKQSGQELLAGRRSAYPKHIENSNDPSHIAVKKSLDMCWTQKWKERPSARSISDYLIGQLKEITGEENPDLRVVLPERDPKQRSTESDYDKYND